MDFRKLPTGHVTLENVTIPGCFLEKTDDLLRTYLSFSDGKITPKRGTAIDMQGAMVLPAFVDMHTHLDKGHIWPRAPNPNGTFQGAIESTSTDRGKNWSPDDVRARMEFALKSAYAHGTQAIRTHLDSTPPQESISWPVFRELRTDWASRIDLQASSLVSCDRVDTEGGFEKTADIVAETGGVLGLVTYPVRDLQERLKLFLNIASDRGRSVDFHTDETLDASVETLRMIAQTVLETGFDAPVVVGHCCSLTTQEEKRALSTLDLVAKAGLHVVSLPMCNLYLQDRAPGRTPRYRGLTLVHEMKARGINISFASDNTRDPFYAYGDLDMVEVMREATRLGHLDHSDTDWPLAFTTNPARACGFETPSLTAGAPAGLIIAKARNWTEFFARPQSDRIVVRNGQQIDRTLPDYTELDHLMEPS